MRHRDSIRLLFLPFVCAALLFAVGNAAIIVLGLGGIGDPIAAKSKIERGMTKDEVRSVLGRPHSLYGGDWVYRCDFLGNTCIHVVFREDGRVSHGEVREAW